MKTYILILVIIQYIHTRSTCMREHKEIKTSMILNWSLCIYIMYLGALLYTCTYKLSYLAQTFYQGDSLMNQLLAKGKGLVHETIQEIHFHLGKINNYDGKCKLLILPNSNNISTCSLLPDLYRYTLLLYRIIIVLTVIWP